MRFRDQPFRKRWLQVAGVSFAICIPWWSILFFGNIGPLNGEGGGFGPLIFSVLNVPVILCSLLYVIAAPIYAFFAKKERQAVLIVLSSVIIYLLCAYFWMRASEYYEKSVFRTAALNAKPLISAIVRFQEEKGAPPATLQELVPKYIPLIPLTGAGGKTEYVYLVPDKAQNPRANYAWELRMNLYSVDPFIVNAIVFRPDQDFADFSPDEFIEGWAHEQFAM